MPTYAYACSACAHAFDVRQSFSDDVLTTCPECERESLRKVFSPVGVVFKGSGFYRTDSRATKGKGAGRSASKESSDGAGSAEGGSASTGGSTTSTDATSTGGGASSTGGGSTTSGGGPGSTGKTTAAPATAGGAGA